MKGDKGSGQEQGEAIAQKREERESMLTANRVCFRGLIRAGFDF